MSRETRSQERDPGRGIHWARVRAFLTGYAFVFRDATSGQAARVLLIFVLSGLGAVLQGASLGVLGFFVNRMSEPQTVELPFGSFEVGENLPSIVLLSTLVFALMAGTAGASYGAGRLARGAGRRFQRRSSRAILESLEGLGADVRGHGFTRQDVSLLTIRSTKILGRAVQNALQSLPGLAQLLVALGIALHLDLSLTLGLAPLVLVLVPTLYLFSGRVQRTSKAFYGEGIAQMSGRLRQLVGAGDASRIGRARARVGDAYDSDPLIERYLDLFDDQVLAVLRVNFITAMFRACSILLLLAIAGYNALRGAFSWGELVAYVGALSYVLNNVQLLAGVFTQLNRFYPHVQNFVAWQQVAGAAPPMDAGVPEGPARELTLRIPDDAEANAGGTVVVKPGVAMTFFTPRVLGRLGFWEAALPLLRGGSLPARSWAQADFMGEADWLEDSSLEAHVFGAGTSREDATRLAAWLERLGVAEAVSAWPEGASTLIDAKRWSEASPDLRAAVRILPLVASPARLVLLAGAALSGTSESFRRALLALFDDRLLIVLCRSARLPVPEIGLVVASDGTRILGSGSSQWFEEASIAERVLRADARSGLEEEEDDDGEF